MTTLQRIGALMVALLFAIALVYLIGAWPVQVARVVLRI